MATKQGSAGSGAKPKMTDYRAENALLKTRVKELESEVGHCKQRLDELRKAKNTTILKREREIVNVSGPGLGRRESGRSLSSDCDHSELEKQLAESERKAKGLEKELSNHMNKPREVQKQTSCNHEELITQLKYEINGLEGDRAALLLENEDLTKSVAGLLTELSLKEANWCEKEEELNQKLKQQWGDKYRQWMEETEKKLFELQQANQLMRTLLKKPKPGDDSGGAAP
ncbi:myosin-2 heavy chain, non muscle-like isoform X2 [Lineus longissimus]|uniref:myosin-2 heavy chain, non muscle-like isoform X2 n=1 Tax=Lineus longissimus TaxID=88925 RepID=UPI00315C95D9